MDKLKFLVGQSLKSPEALISRLEDLKFNKNSKHFDKIVNHFKELYEVNKNQFFDFEKYFVRIFGLPYAKHLKSIQDDEKYNKYYIAEEKN